MVIAGWGTWPPVQSSSGVLTKVCQFQVGVFCPLSTRLTPPALWEPLTINSLQEAPLRGKRHLATGKGLRTDQA